MKSDFELITRDFKNGPITVYPVGDVHLGAIEHQGKEWDAFLAQVLADPSAYLILVGDLINNNTRSSVGSPWDDLCRPQDQKRIMANQLAPLRDRILCCCSGNHERRSLKDSDDDPTYDILNKLDLEDCYRPNACFLRMRVGARVDSTARTPRYIASYLFAVTHGSGGGNLTGSTINNAERWGDLIAGADCVISGHTHKGGITRPARIVIDPTHNQVTLADYICVSVPSWQAYGSYALQKRLKPAATSRPQKLELLGTTKQINITW